MEMVRSDNDMIMIMIMIMIVIMIVIMIMIMIVIMIMIITFEWKEWSNELSLLIMSNSHYTGLGINDCAICVYLLLYDS